MGASLTACGSERVEGTVSLATRRLRLIKPAVLRPVVSSRHPPCGWHRTSTIVCGDVAQCTGIHVCLRLHVAWLAIVAESLPQRQPL
jgi:hypothetical protein